MTEHTIVDSSAAQSWRKSSYSDTQGGNCVEVLDNHPTAVPVRDSKNPNGPTLTFTTEAWTSFITAIKNTELPT